MLTVLVFSIISVPLCDRLSLVAGDIYISGVPCRVIPSWKGYSHSCPGNALHHLRPTQNKEPNFAPYVGEFLLFILGWSILWWANSTRKPSFCHHCAAIPAELKQIFPSSVRHIFQCQCHSRKSLWPVRMSSQSYTGQGGPSSLQRCWDESPQREMGVSTTLSTPAFLLPE